MARKVAVITGGNSGIGYGIAQRLLDDPPYPHFTIVLACRNLQRADEARASLLAAHAAELLERDDDQATTKPDVDVQVLQLDTSRPASVLAAARDIRRRFATLDYLFCNAGILPASSIAYLRAAYYIFSAPHYFITSSVALNQVRGQLTPEGLGLVFATNAFGHYLLIRTLEPYLFNRPADHGSEGDGTRIIWTSSNTSAHIGSTGAFRPDDYQHIEGPNPYESSKMIGDTVSMYLNQRYADKPVWSFITEPGTVASNIYAEIGNWLLSLIIVLVNYAFRLAGVAELTITPYNGGLAPYYVAVESETELDLGTRYLSRCTRWGTPYVAELPVAADDNIGPGIMRQLDALVTKFSATESGKEEVAT